VVTGSESPGGRISERTGFVGRAPAALGQSAAEDGKHRLVLVSRGGLLEGDARLELQDAKAQTGREIDTIVSGSSSS